MNFSFASNAKDNLPLTLVSAKTSLDKSLLYLLFYKVKCHLIVAIIRSTILANDNIVVNCLQFYFI